ncbi:MAG: hypothetical protein PHG67_09370 [Bacteroidales bacterium]|jgi:hypothetical protein|nr:hypothetical protein [Bacteroidales bacterium]HOI32385.1 hypothetical protein [Bacteroidales bacterium]
MEHQIIKYNRIQLLLAFMLVLGLSSCYKDNEETLYPEEGNNCKTENISFSENIFPIVNNNCLSCHSGAGASGGLRLENHTQISDAAVNGRLLGAINHEPGFPAMPQSGNKLSECQIKQFEAWVQQGALNN